MIRYIYFVGAGELRLPVTPSEFTLDAGVAIETIHIHELGDVHIAGYPSLATIKISSFFPVQSYPFGAMDREPYAYVEQFKRWAQDRQVVRWIVSGTGINMPVLIENIQYGERDGTNDVYFTLTLKEYRAVGAARVESGSAQNMQRVDELGVSPVKPEAIVAAAGDTVASLCLKQYGEASEATKKRVAEKNGMKNPDLALKVGQAVMMPK